MYCTLERQEFIIFNHIFRTLIAYKTVHFPFKNGYFQIGKKLLFLIIHVVLEDDKAEKYVEF